MKNINCESLKAEMKNNNIFLIDVREVFEHAEKNIGGINIPVTELPNRISEIPLNEKVAIYCRSGARSEYAISFLQKNFGFKNLINLNNGIIGCH